MLERTPDDASAHNLAGVVYLTASQADQASKHFLKAFELNPAYITSLHNLAKLALQAQDNDAAVDRYEQILGIDPNNVQAMSELAKIASADDRTDDAVRRLEKVLAIDTTLLESELALLEMYLVRGNQSQARHLAQGMVDRFPRNIAVRVAKGRVKLAASSPQRASETFKSLANRDLQSPPRLLGYAKYLLAASDVAAGLFSGAYQGCLSGVGRCDYRGQAL
ncbi:MAG: tetratricopeptide repeat protein [Chromatiales bacterium]|jgi:tetratricopeptide (TPR) repeat protein|nr:tetratricopeptide repeat protein [Chromatiales bacterium]